MRRPSSKPGDCEVTWVKEGWLLPTFCWGSRPLSCRSARDPSPVHTFPVPPDELWMSQPEFFHTLPLLHSAHRQLSCGFQPLSGPNASNIKKRKKILLSFFWNAPWQGMGNPRTCAMSGPHSHNVLLNSLACVRNHLVLSACFAPLSLPLAECIDRVN